MIDRRSTLTGEWIEMKKVLISRQNYFSVVWISMRLKHINELRWWAASLFYSQHSWEDERETFYSSNSHQYKFAGSQMGSSTWIESWSITSSSHSRSRLLSQVSCVPNYAMFALQGLRELCISLYLREWCTTDTWSFLYPEMSAFVHRRACTVLTLNHRDRILHWRNRWGKFGSRLATR